MKKPFILLCFLFFVINANAGNLDSLLSVLKTAKNDTNKVLLLNSICYKLTSQKKFKEILEYAEEMSTLSNKLNYLKGKIYSQFHSGIGLTKLNRFDEALQHFDNAIKIYERINNPSGEAWINGYIGNVYYRKELFTKAIEYYLKALKYYEFAGKKYEYAGYAGNIGMIYNSLNENDKALDFYFKSLKINEEIKNEQGIAINFVCIANAYNDQKKFNEANKYYQNALALNLKNGDKEYIANNYSNLGLVNINLENYIVADEYLQKALDIYIELKNEYDVSKVESLYGELYLLQKNYLEAEKILQSSLLGAEKLNNQRLQSEIHASLSKVYSKIGKYDLSLDHFKKHIIWRDSIKNISSQKEVLRKQLLFDFEKKEALTKIEFEKEQSRKQLEIEKRKQAIVQLEKDNVLKQLNLSKSNLQLKEKEAENESQKKQVELLNKDKLIQESLNAQKNNELEQQKKLRNIFVFGAIVLFCFAIYILFNLSKSKKTNKLIERQKQEVETQKHLVEEKQKEIVDSINYAQRIQYALLANKKLLDENLKDYFLLFKPKDVVSGDFYWASKLNNDTFLLATADSTGHGVPGAIMSILNISCLNESVNSDRLLLPSEILNATRQKIISHLMNDGSTEGGKDGMDCSLICIDFKQLKLQYAAANNPIWIHRGNSIISLKADKMPVGKHDKDTMPFTNNTFVLSKGDVIYTFTDGFADQFGGEKGKKFKYKQLEELLLSISSNTMSNQHDALLNRFNQWKGNLEQVDDVSVIGIRV
jgi:serine phosphatase RsbU (regulator of sigma subunit)